MGNSGSSGIEQVRRLIAHRGSHPVISLYLDLERGAVPDPVREVHRGPVAD